MYFRQFRNWAEAKAWLDASFAIMEEIARPGGMLETEAFKRYEVNIRPKVPKKTGRTRKSPQRGAEYSRNVLEWNPEDPITGKEYVGSIYFKNKTGIPNWDMKVAEEQNETRLRKFNTGLLRVFK